MGHGKVPDMPLVYYISSHGLGHAVRSIEILRHLDPSVPVWIKSGAPEWFFRQELKRPFHFAAATFDCGALEGDNQEIDREKTLRSYAAIANQNRERIPAEAEWLRRVGARLVVSDIASFPFAAAREVGLPSAAVANFTWAEIYEPYCREFPAYGGLLQAIRGEYAMADLAVIAPPDVPMPLFRRVQRVSLIARKGCNRRPEIAEAYGADPRRRWLLLYPSNLGAAFDVATLGQFPEIDFFTFSAIDTRRAPNLRQVEQGRFWHPDVLASVDGVISKPGYGMVGECMANGVPLLYVERDHFAEYEALDRALRAWGGAARIGKGDFAAGRWQEPLARLATLKPQPVADADGGAQAARILETMIAAPPAKIRVSS
ncbi:MAG: hypothetical protein NTW86_15850 [Candidatus Sumerlaeota bacterium]|nr:hypothetical protein [Candidatus Sumerlaeota bacterium]